MANLKFIKLCFNKGKIAQLLGIENGEMTVSNIKYNEDFQEIELLIAVDSQAEVVDRYELVENPIDSKKIFY